MTARRGLVVAGAVLVALLGVFLLVRPGSAPAAPASTGCAVLAAAVPGAAASTLPVRPLCSLPPEAPPVWSAIEAGGPFAYGRDGVVFGNREKGLPARASGYYHEYTVTTPGEGDRGARRLVTGGARGPAQELYYSDDHYASFVVVDATATR